jgi:homoserine/homoserine lactone efflux protein
VSLTVWLSLLAASVVISFTPGAGAINTMSNALNEGWRRAFWGVIGQQLALIVHVVIVAAGIGLLVARSPFLFDLVRYVGAAYLVFLGIRMMLSRASAPDDPDVPRIREAGSSPRSSSWMSW